jgi:hypothetical protein
VTARDAKSRHIQRQPPPRVLAVLVVGAFLLAAWLDRHRAGAVQEANLFSWIVAALQFVAQNIGPIVHAAIDTVEDALVYLARSVGWIAARLVSIVTSSGAMFARVWEWVRRAYENVLKPALIWLHDEFVRVTAWLRNYFKPVFDFLSHVRTVLMDIYTRFLKPILTALAIIDAFLRLLADFHVEWAAKLDQIVQEIQGAITENFLKILGWVNEARDVINAVVTPDRLFQRLPFVSTLNRDAGWMVRIFWNSQIAPLIAAELEAKKAQAIDATPATYYGAQLGAFYRNGGGDYAANIGDLVAVWKTAATI